MISIREYPERRSKYGRGISDFGCIFSYDLDYSGIICIKDIDTNIPPANAFATPRTLGDSLNFFDLTGRYPINSASQNARIMKANLYDYTLFILYF